ncbi:MAG TPA: 4a-hydroxytetrahydrobiopterin dehydratase [Motiliproteus sp.]
MAPLCEEGCEVCRVGAPAVDASEAQQLLRELPEWQRMEQDGISRLVREYRCANFAEALAFTNRVGEMAETMQHHPQITLEWGRVELQWWTHKIRGLHRNDFVCAARSDRLFAPA